MSNRHVAVMWLWCWRKTLVTSISCFLLVHLSNLLYFPICSTTGTFPPRLAHTHTHTWDVEYYSIMFFLGVRISVEIQLYFKNMSTCLLASHHKCCFLSFLWGFPFFFSSLYTILICCSFSLTFFFSFSLRCQMKSENTTLSPENDFTVNPHHLLSWIGRSSCGSTHHLRGLEERACNSESCHKPETFISYKIHWKKSKQSTQVHFGTCLNLIRVLPLTPPLNILLILCVVNKKKLKYIQC